MKRRTNHVVRCAAVILLGVQTLAGCTDEGPTGPNASDPTSTESEHADTVGTLYGLLMPQTAYGYGEEGSRICVQAIFLASEQNGGSVTTVGTLRQTSPGAQTFTYQRTPTDGLVVTGADGSSLRFAVQDFQGDLRSADDFLKNDRILRFELSSPDGGSLAISQEQQNGTLRSAISGTMHVDGTAHTVDLEEEGTVSFEADGSFASYERRTTLNGTISTDGTEAVVGEEYIYKSIFNSNESKMVENVTRRSSSSWTRNGTRYDLVDGLVRKSFVNGRPAELDSFWQASGSLLRDNTQFGTIGGGIEGNAIKIWLDTEQGRTVLESHVL